jgi:hypothetical protein
MRLRKSRERLHDATPGQTNHILDITVDRGDILAPA